MATSGKATKSAPSKMTVGFLRERMDAMQLSPERLAELVPISNMTIRRWLEQPASTKISDKYAGHLAQALTMPDLARNLMGSSSDLLQVVENLKADGEKIGDTKKLESQMKSKLKETGAEIKALAKDLWGYVSKKSNVTVRSIAIGAILYLVNPFDLIPDSIPVVGYLDDFAVMTLALSQIHVALKKQRDA